jgi:hypothetical protein
MSAGLLGVVAACHNRPPRTRVPPLTNFQLRLRTRNGPRGPLLTATPVRQWPTALWMSLPEKNSQYRPRQRTMSGLRASTAYHVFARGATSTRSATGRPRSHTARCPWRAAAEPGSPTSSSPTAAENRTARPGIAVTLHPDEVHGAA